MSLHPSHGHTILVVVEKLLTSMVLIPTVSIMSAKETARLYFNCVYSAWVGQEGHLRQGRPVHWVFLAESAPVAPSSRGAHRNSEPDSR
jgi:hypothetical protein